VIKMNFGKDKVPAFYLEGMSIEAKIRQYKWAKEETIKTLRLLSYLMSDCEGKKEEIDIQLSGDLRLEVTHLKLPYFLYKDFVLNEQDIKWLKEQVGEYTRCVDRGDGLRDARSILVDLEKWLWELVHKKTWAFGIASEDIQRTAHTPIVIKAKKRNE
jgi:hypothetical protein